MPGNSQHFNTQHHHVLAHDFRRFDSILANHNYEPRLTIADAVPMSMLPIPTLRHVSTFRSLNQTSFRLPHLARSAPSSFIIFHTYSTNPPVLIQPLLQLHYTTDEMGKKKVNKGEYNDFLDGEKLLDNAEIRTSLNSTAAPSGQISPPLVRRVVREKEKGTGAGRLPLTHFLCLPLVNSGSRPQLEKSLESLKGELEKEGLVPLKAVRPLGTLHLTLGVMSLNAQRLEEAGRCLQDLDLRSLLRDATSQAGEGFEGTVSLLDDKAQEDQPLSVDLKGLVPMQAQNKTSILYTDPLDVTSRLYPFASALRDLFASKGFLVEDERSLKLHATIINTIYAKVRGKRPRQVAEVSTNTPYGGSGAGEVSGQDTSTQEQDRSQGHGPNAKSLLKFDATKLIEQYNDTLWAEDVRIEKVQICRMGAKKVLNDNGDVVSEEYEEVFSKTI